MNKSFSYWERDEWLKPPDLFIVGGGIVGCSVACFYKQRFPGHDVVIAEKGIAPEGASTRNAGFACIGSVSEHLADMEIAGEVTVLNRIERRWRGLNLLKSEMGEEAMQYENTGGYEIFTDRELFERCKKQVPWLNHHLKERLGIDDVYSVTEKEGYPAIFNNAEGALNSGRLMRTLHGKLAEMGVRVWWNTEVKRAEEKRIVLKNGVEVHPEKTVLAVNGFISRLANIPVKPARGYVFVTSPVDDLPWRGTFHHNAGYVYFRNVGNRLLLGGARDLDKEGETTDQFGINPKIKKYLHDFANDVLKLQPGWSIESEWSGIMGITENKEPIVKEIYPGTWVAAGLSGMGIAIGMEVAKGLVDSWN